MDTLSEDGYIIPRQQQLPQTVASSGNIDYPEHQQSTLLQPVSAQYSLDEYSNGLMSPQTAEHEVTDSGDHGNASQLPGMSTSGQVHLSKPVFDTTGQVAPPGMKARVTATLWEDEGSWCFQVEARSVCVSRREGNVLFFQWNSLSPIGT